MYPDGQPVRCSAVSDVLDQLGRTGLVLVGGIPNPTRMLSLTRRLGASVVAHRDSGPDGVTVLEDRGARGATMAGFTRASLFPHTDSSGLETPPGLLFTVCGREPTTGGNSVLVDGRAVFSDLAENDPLALEELSEPCSVLFGGADGHLGSVFAPVEGVVSVRCRLDALARFGPRVVRHVPALRSAIDRHALTIPARAGSGYILDNRRWLHGRLAYEGPRIVYRVLADPRPGTIVGGFRIDPS